MAKQIMFVTATIIAWTYSVQAAPTNTYSAFGDFSTNPTGAWSYLYANTVGGPLSALTTPINFYGAPGISDNQPVPNSIAVIANTSSAPITGSNTVVIQPGTLNLDPESGTVVVQWTAPAAGIYNIVGNFVGDDTNEHSPIVSVTDSQIGAALLNTTIPYYDAVADFDFTEALNAGQSISFTVSENFTYTDLSTGLSATISLEPTTTVPEPASIALFGAGLTGIFAAARRRKMSDLTIAV